MASRFDLSNLSAQDRPWVMAQMGVMAAGALLPVLFRRKPTSVADGFGRAAAGAASIAAGTVVFSQAKTHLAESFTVAPTPTAEGRLIDDGPYGLVRHPMYLAATLLTFGWARLWGGPLATLAPLGLLAFFLRKADFEEEQLRDRYADYDAYAARVPNRVLPGVL